MRIGILGGGQLARMLALAGQPLGMSFVFVDPAADACAGSLGELIVAEYDDQVALTELAERVDLVTLDFENVPVSAVRWLSEKIPVRPGAAALEVAQDRLVEKNFFRGLGIATADFCAVDSLSELTEAVAAMAGGPAILKTRRLGYDGKGQFAINSAGDVPAAWNALGGQALILERKIAFQRELSVLIARSIDGSTAIWPLAENHHVDGILRTSTAPAGQPDSVAAANELATRVVDALDYYGVLAIELFELADGQLLVNEMAPRVHNSGHWTIDGAVCSQFENHLRAITGLPLGATDSTGESVMVNWIGRLPDPTAVFGLPGVHWHDYGKSPRPGRKVGHATVVADQPAIAHEIGEQLLSIAD